MAFCSNGSECQASTLRYSPLNAYGVELGFKVTGSTACKNEDKQPSDMPASRLFRDQNSKCLIRSHTCPEMGDEFTLLPGKTEDINKPRGLMSQITMVNKRTKLQHSPATTNAPIVIIVDDNEDQNGNSTSKMIDPTLDHPDPNRLAPPIEEFDSNDRSKPLKTSPVTYRSSKADMFTFDDISEEESEEKEERVNVIGKSFSGMKLKDALDNDKKTSDLDLVKLKAMTARLNLTTRRQSYITWKEEYLDKPLLAKYMPQMTKKKKVPTATLR